MTYEPIPGLAPSRNPTHWRYRTPDEVFARRRMTEILRGPKRGRPKFRIDTSFRPEPVDCSLIARKHAASLARRNAFLDLNAAVGRYNAHVKAVVIAGAMGKELDPSRKQEDMEYWLNRYRDAVAEQKRVFHPELSGL